MMLPVLLLEDDQSLGYILSEYLGMQEISVVWAKTAEEAMDLIEHQDFGLAILDIMLPGIDGFEFAEILKAKSPDVPFLFLSAKSLKIDKLKGYKLGAFDYMTKPVDEELLVAKIKVLLKNRFKQQQTEALCTIGKYSFAPKEQQLIIDKKVIKLTSREAELLEMLFAHKNQLLSRKAALKQLWGYVDEFNRKSMDVFISHLRKYLSQDPNVTIENVHGKGFILKF